jgi:Flp pilus assembly CpaF family ATPase
MTGHEYRGVDHLLVRRLQERIGKLRQAEVDARKVGGSPPLRGEDNIEFGRHLVQEVVSTHTASLAEAGRAPLTSEAREDLVQALEARLFGAGSLQQLLEDPEVEDVQVNGYANVFVEYADGSRAQLPAVAASNADLIRTIQTLAAHDGLSSRPFDDINYRVNLRLPDGSRLYAVQKITPVGVAVSIRKHRHLKVTLEDLVGLGTLDEALADFLRAVVVARKNVMIAGATGAGKTTLLRALAAEIPPEERLITIERSLELGLHEDVDRHPNCVPMEERYANVEGVGAVTQKDLLQDSLRMRPDRVIVGEVLGDEVVTMLNAMMQGNDGSLSTIHANSSADVAAKVRTYALQAPERLPWEASEGLFVGAIDFVVFVRRIRLPAGGQARVVESIREITAVDETGIKSNELWKPGPQGLGVRQEVIQPSCVHDLAEAGWAEAAGYRRGPAGDGRWV